MKLIDLKNGEKALISEIKGGQKFIQRLNAMGLSIGQCVQKISKVRMGGPVIIEINRAQIAIGRGMAEKINVKVCDCEY